MFGRTWNHDSLRKYIIVFGTVFNDIYINRLDNDQEVRQTLKVPLTYGPKDKVLARLEQNPEMLGWSGIFAVVAANVVIAAYVIMAWNEDEDDKNEARAKAKKLHLQSAKKES